MKRVRVKICGITNTADLNAAVDFGADAVGFVVDVPGSPRSVSMGRARDLIEAMPPFVQSVVVSVFQNLNKLELIRSRVVPDVIQMAGPLPRDVVFDKHICRTRVIRVITLDNSEPSLSELSSASRFDAVLTDSHAPGTYGGTGKPHKWSISRAVRDRIAPTPLILAGGLTADNVRVAIETVRPYAVDVSSGVEIRPGVKDPSKIRGFIEAVTETSDEL